MGINIRDIINFCQEYKEHLIQMWSEKVLGQIPLKNAAKKVYEKTRIADCLYGKISDPLDRLNYSIQQIIIAAKEGKVTLCGTETITQKKNALTKEDLHRCDLNPNNLNYYLGNNVLYKNIYVKRKNLRRFIRNLKSQIGDKHS